MSQKTELYESRGVWDQELQLGQKNLLRAIIDFMPDEVDSVLDVGCGDGKITSQLIAETQKKIVGLDSSQEALSRCNFETVVGDATAVSFRDQTFDLVMTTDMLEHLPAAIEEKSWNELFRLAARYVMVAVPFREELLDGTTRCPDCGSTYHVNWHMRSYDWPKLLERKPLDWCVESVVLTGQTWSLFHPIETRFRRHVLGEYAGWSESNCPQCGRKGSYYDQPVPLSPKTAKWLGRLMYQHLGLHGAHRLHSEVLVVFKREHDASCSRKRPFLRAVAESRSAGFVKLSESTPEVNLSPFPTSARVVRSNDGGLVVQFPVYGDPTGLTIVCLSQSVGTLQLDIEDGDGSLYSGSVTSQAGVKLRISFTRAVSPGYYGLRVRIPNTETNFSLELDGGLFGLFLTGGSPSIPAYHPITLGGTAGFVQITKSDWFNPGWLSHPVQAVQLEPWIGLLDETGQIAQSERDSLKFELDSLQQRPEVRWSNRLRQRIASIQRSINLLSR